MSELGDRLVQGGLELDIIFIVHAIIEGQKHIERQIIVDLYIFYKFLRLSLKSG